MEEDLFKHLPSEIMLNILLRLPARTIMSCKCVCKPWLDLLATPEFVKSHLSKSVPGLAVFLKAKNSKTYKIFEFEDEHRWNTVFNFNLPIDEPMQISINGLLGCRGVEGFLLCNPITRDYIAIPSPPRPFSIPMFWVENYGFGVSRKSCQYKVVRVFNERSRSLKTHLGFVDCQIYTVGTGLWRQIACRDPLRFVANSIGAFLNGNLHWLAFNGSSRKIYVLDLESELFSTFSPPPLDDDPRKTRKLSVLQDCLCACDVSDFLPTLVYNIDIWLMKEYEDEKSWTKEFVIRTVYRDDHFGFVWPIKIFKDGDILMELGCGKLVYYSSMANTIQEAHDMFGLETNSLSITNVFSPSFLSLKTFAMENVISF